MIYFILQINWENFTLNLKHFCRNEKYSGNKYSESILNKDLF